MWKRNRQTAIKRKEVNKALGNDRIISRIDGISSTRITESFVLITEKNSLKSNCYKVFRRLQDQV